MVDEVERYETDSYLVAGWPTLLRVDHELSVPAKKIIRFLVSSVDVLHNWAIPSAGIKVYARPGRFNAGTIYFQLLELSQFRREAELGMFTPAWSRVQLLEDLIDGVRSSNGRALTVQAEGRIRVPRT